MIATNTTLSRTAVAACNMRDEAGGLSGKPVFDASNEVIRKLRAEVGETVPIIGVGGIFSGDDARAKLAAGASLVQLYTGFIYRGPALVGECAQALRLRHSATGASPHSPCHRQLYGHKQTVFRFR